MLGYVFGAAVQRDEPSTARHVCFIAELNFVSAGQGSSKDAIKQNKAEGVEGGNGGTMGTIEGPKRDHRGTREGPERDHRGTMGTEGNQVDRRR